MGAWTCSGCRADASFAFVTGCQMAHFTALAAARHQVLAEAGWDVERDGLAGAPPIRVLVRREAPRHGRPRAAACSASARPTLVAADDQGRMVAERAARRAARAATGRRSSARRRAR